MAARWITLVLVLATAGCSPSLGAYDQQLGRVVAIEGKVAGYFGDARSCGPIDFLIDGVQIGAGKLASSSRCQPR